MSSPTVAVFDFNMIKRFSKSRLKTPARAFVFWLFWLVTSLLGLLCSSFAQEKIHQNNSIVADTWIQKCIGDIGDELSTNGNGYQNHGPGFKRIDILVQCGIQ